MDGVKVAWRSWLAANAFLFWAVVEAVTKSIYWYKEASRELLVLNPRKPRDLYDNGYVLFVYEVVNDGWSGYWRKPDAPMGAVADEMYDLLGSQWGYVPFHEVEFSEMEHITYKVRAVSREWCKSQGIQRQAYKVAA